VTDEVVQAFKAGWRTNAVHEDAAYLDGCEAADLAQFQKQGFEQYMGSLHIAHSVAMAESAAFSRQCCTCDGVGEVGGMTPDGFDSMPCPACSSAHRLRAEDWENAAHELLWEAGQTDIFEKLQEAAERQRVSREARAA